MTLLLASDLDGPIVPRGAPPGSTVWRPAAQALFTMLDGRDDVALAIVSGRDPAEVMAAASGLRCFHIASFGRHVCDPATTVVRTAPHCVTASGAWVREVHAAGGIVEQKPHGIGVHWHTSAALRANRAASAAFRTWARCHGLRIIVGRTSVEAVVPGLSKLGALRVVATLAQATRVIYIGDDASDVPALRWAAQRGGAFYVGTDRDHLAHIGVHVVRSFRALWRAVRTSRHVDAALRR